MRCNNYASCRMKHGKAKGAVYEMKKIIFDTDIGCDIDDALCLTYLLQRTDCELLGITTVSGQVQLRAELASAICMDKGRDIPIYKGAAEPLMSGKTAEFPQQSQRLRQWPHRWDFPQTHAVEFMRQTIYKYPGQVTLLATGPLTNVALLFCIYPECISMLQGLYIMGGKYLGQKQLEWNLKFDPHAAQIVFDADTLLVAAGLDATLSFCMSAQDYADRFRGSQPYLACLAEDWYREIKTPIYFHDPLATTLIFRPDAGKLLRGRAGMRPSPNAEVSEYSFFCPDPNGPHLICAEPDIEAFSDDFFGTLGVEDTRLTVLG